MAAGKYNIEIEQGADWTLRVVLYGATGSLRDLTGCTARMQIREVYEDKKVHLDLKSITSGGIVIEPLIGRIELSATAAQTAKLSITRCVYDLELVNPNGTVERVIMGKVTISREVTRSS